jgi:prepilin-type N-terminal cleavage/methylation domain-containing protein
MKIRSQYHNYRGFTLIEMITVVAILGIILGFAIPSFLTLRKPLRDGVNQFTSQLALIRTKAIASNQAYRIKPKYTTLTEYVGENGYTNIPRSFVVEYAANCQVTTVGGTNGWQRASQFDLDLPKEVGVTAATGAALNWNICYNNRGIVNTSVNLTFADYQANNRAKTASVIVRGLGGVRIKTYDNTNATGTGISDSDLADTNLIF